jgi:hypothetical protein
MDQVWICHLMVLRWVCLLISSPLELLPPAWKLLELPCVICDYLKLSVVGWSQLDNKDPSKEVKAGLVKMVKEIFLDAAPTAM